MFDFNEELKYYEPGLETVEATLSGDVDKDLVELMQALLQARPDPLAAKAEEAEEKTVKTSGEESAEEKAESEQKEPAEA